MNKVSKQGQSFLDKVTHLTGSCENALEMAILNGVSFTENLAIGQVLKPSRVTNRIVAGFFNPVNEPATALTYETIADINNEGIGQMIIESTFIVQ